MIPKILHQVWVGPKAPPVAALQSWRRMNPSWDQRVWTMTEHCAGQPWILQKEINAWAERGGWNGVGDLMRYEVLLRHGGVAVDADSECVRPLDARFTRPDFWTGYENEMLYPGMLANAAMGCEPEHPLMNALVQGSRGVTPAHGHAWDVTGPMYQTRTLQGCEGVTVYPSRHFIPWHFCGASAPGEATIFARQFWGSTLPGPWDVTDPGYAVVSTGGPAVWPWAAACVQSVLNQTVAVRHIVCCDGRETIAAARSGAWGPRGCLVEVIPGCGNAVDNLLRACADLEVGTKVLWLDLDDFLLPKTVEIVRDAYRYDPDLQVTYGNFAQCWPGGGRYSCPEAFSQDVVQRGAYREVRDHFIPSHPKTFQVDLLWQIPRSAFEGRSEHGACIDGLVMFPLLELSKGRNMMLPWDLYRYNTRNLPLPPELKAHETAECHRICGLPRVV